MGARSWNWNPATRIELGFLLIAGIVAFGVRLPAQIHLVLGVALLAWFGSICSRSVRARWRSPILIGTRQRRSGLMPDRAHRRIVVALFVVAAVVILLSAKPFADSMISAGTQLGIDRFLLVQWLAPLASEAPEFIIAVIFAARGNATAAIATLISSGVNQWTLLVGSLPLAYLAGGGGVALPLDPRRVEETLITAAQTMIRCGPHPVAALPSPHRVGCCSGSSSSSSR